MSQDIHIATAKTTTADTLGRHIPCPLAQRAREDGDVIALQSTHSKLTYRALDVAVTRLVQLLQAHGATKGDRILVQVQPTEAHIALLFACWRAGVVYVPISPKQPEGQRQRLAHITQARYWVGSSPERPPDGTTALVDWQTLFPTGWAEQAAMMPGVPAPLPSLAPDQEATALLTSGSTSQPKAALHSFENHYYSALGSQQNIALAPGDQWLLSLPLYHVAGIAIAMRCVVAGATIAIPQPERELIDHLILQQPSHLSLVATQLTRLLEMGPQAIEVLQQCKAILLGGSAIPKGLLRKSEALGLRIFTSYGATEMASQITTTRPGDGLQEWLQAGHCLPYRALQLGPKGEILVRGETRFLGYLSEAGLQQPFDAEGWFATGDLGSQTADGALIVQGRQDSMFISGGENIQPEEIERALEQHADVEQVIVVDVPSTEFGARPCAFVKMKQDKRLQSTELRKFLKQHIASFKVPDRFFYWPQEAPTTGIKISRSTLRKIAHQA